MKVKGNSFPPLLVLAFFIFFGNIWGNFEGNFWGISKNKTAFLLNFTTVACTLLRRRSVSTQDYGYYSVPSFRVIPDGVYHFYTFIWPEIQLFIVTTDSILMIFVYIQIARSYDLKIVSCFKKRKDHSVPLQEVDRATPKKSEMQKARSIVQAGNIRVLNNKTLHPASHNFAAKNSDGIVGKIFFSLLSWRAIGLGYQLRFKEIFN